MTDPEGGVHDVAVTFTDDEGGFRFEAQRRRTSPEAPSGGRLSDAHVALMESGVFHLAGDFDGQLVDMYFKDNMMATLVDAEDMAALAALDPAPTSWSFLEA
jgi:hypothetical protein